MGSSPKNTASRKSTFLKAYAKGASAIQVCRENDIPSATMANWVKGDAVFRAKYYEIKAAQRDARGMYDGTIFDPDRETPERLPFVDWRPYYLGRQVEDHQLELVEAFEDKTNSRIFMFGPPGMGKDTTAGDLLLYEIPYDRSKRSCWIMKGENFSKRRVAERLDPYLTDSKVYNYQPEGGSSVKPAGSLIEDLGPFKWSKGMAYPDGTPIDATTWTKSEIYLLGDSAPEADPNFWATGIEGQLYGSRVDLMVMSDVFDRENQRNPTARIGQYEWVMGTARSRLDTRGRLVVLGTRCLPDDNYGQLMDTYVGTARVVHQGKYYTKYSNGVATVIIPAIGVDEDGNDTSYWPERFPLESYLETPDGTRYLVDSLDDDDIARLQDSGAERIQGLYEMRDLDPDLFETMYQQNPPFDVTGDFTDAILEKSDDDTRTYGTHKPNELVVVGVDPARVAGAAWVAWAVDKAEETITLVDYRYHENLGITGIKQKLVTYPITQYEPIWFAYETNRNEAVLDDPEIGRVFQDFSVSVHRHHTSVGNRSVDPKKALSVPALAFYMKSATIRWPMMTAEDRRKTLRVKEHFKAWDRKETTAGTKSSTKGHPPDDIAMAAWVGFIKAHELLYGKKNRHLPRVPVPAAVRQRWDRFQKEHRTGKKVKDTVPRPAAATYQDIVNLVLTED